LALAPRTGGEKTNEIPELPRLLAPLPLQGALVTADALHTQQETARYLVEEKKADYPFTAKDNQPALKQGLRPQLLSYALAGHEKVTLR
jgi:predicted transposase YbfD/YdcC